METKGQSSKLMKLTNNMQRLSTYSKEYTYHLNINTLYRIFIIMLQVPQSVSLVRRKYSRTIKPNKLTQPTLHKYQRRLQ